jgi:hypothetical protein
MALRNTINHLQNASDLFTIVSEEKDCVSFTVPDQHCIGYFWR